MIPPNKFDYAKDSPYFDPANKKVIGKSKDEAAGIPITEFYWAHVKDTG